MPRHNKIPQGYMCSVMTCKRFDTSMVKLGESTVWLCRKHKGCDRLVIAYHGTLVPINRVKGYDMNKACKYCQRQRTLAYYSEHDGKPEYFPCDCPGYKQSISDFLDSIDTGESGVIDMRGV